MLDGREEAVLSGWTASPPPAPRDGRARVSARLSLTALHLSVSLTKNRAGAPGAKKIATRRLGEQAGTAIAASQTSRGSARLASAGRSLAQRMAALAIQDRQEAQTAAAWRLEIERRHRKVIEWFAPAKRAAYAAHVAICRQEQEALAPYREARRELDRKLAQWNAEQRDWAARATEASTSIEAGLPEPGEPRAELPTDPNLPGVSFRDRWCAEVSDLRQFIAAVARNPALLNLVEPNPAALNSLARAQKRALKIPGVRVWCERIVATTGRR